MTIDQDTARKMWESVASAFNSAGLSYHGVPGKTNKIKEDMVLEMRATVKSFLAHDGFGFLFEDPPPKPTAEIVRLDSRKRKR